jgi:hypothetical protein
MLHVSYTVQITCDCHQPVIVLYVLAYGGVFAYATAG